jgi:hypothetical protein
MARMGALFSVGCHSDLRSDHLDALKIGATGKLFAAFANPRILAEARGAKKIKSNDSVSDGVERKAEKRSGRPESSPRKDRVTARNPNPEETRP